MINICFADIHAYVTPAMRNSFDHPPAPGAAESALTWRIDSAGGRWLLHRSGSQSPRTCIQRSAPVIPHHQITVTLRGSAAQHDHDGSLPRRRHGPPATRWAPGPAPAVILVQRSWPSTACGRHLWAQLPGDRSTVQSSRRPGPGRTGRSQ
jgi:hypothetical protein